MEVKRPPGYYTNRLASPSTLIMNWHCLSTMLSNLFLHSLFQSLSVPLMFTFQHSPSHLRNLLFPESSVQGFPTLLQSLKGNQVTGQRWNSLQSTTRILYGIWSSLQMNAPLLRYHSKLCMSVTLKPAIAFQVPLSCIVVGTYRMPASVLMGNVFYFDLALMQ